MQLLYPADPLRPKCVEEIFEEEFHAASKAGIPVSLFSFEDFQSGHRYRLTTLESNRPILYRGWMLNAMEYQKLADFIHSQGHSLLTSPETYLRCHHLPGWYEELKEFTAETKLFSDAHEMEASLHAEQWDGCFLKDFVKSLSTGEGSVVTNLSHLPGIVEKMRKFRGEIEGGLCARRIEEYLPDSERRFFVYQGIAYSDHRDIPPEVQIAAERIGNPFFSVDTAIRLDGTTRIIELGDGQVSDRKHWNAEDFIRIFVKK